MAVFLKMNVDKAKLEIVDVEDGGIFNCVFGRQRKCEKDDCQPEIIDDDDEANKKSLILGSC